MKIKTLLLATLISSMNIIPSVTHAQYITVLEETHYEKYVVDTNSLYYPDKKHKFEQFNCIIWFYDNPELVNGTPYVMQYKFEDNTWKLAEQDGNKLVWNKIKENSVAANTLKIMLAYIENK